VWLSSPRHVEVASWSGDGSLGIGRCCLFRRRLPIEQIRNVRFLFPLVSSCSEYLDLDHLAVAVAVSVSSCIDFGLFQ